MDVTGLTAALKQQQNQMVFKDCDAEHWLGIAYLITQAKAFLSTGRVVIGLRGGLAIPAE